MHSRRVRPTAGRCSSGNRGDFLVQLTLDEQDRIDAWELCREIVRLGGVETRRGFAFTTDSRREAALEMLGERYEARCFKKVNDHVTCEQRVLADEVVASE